MCSSSMYPPFMCSFWSPATFDGKQHLLSLPVVNSIGYVLRFLKKLCRSLHCENLFSDQPIGPHSGGSYHSDGTQTCCAESPTPTRPREYLEPTHQRRDLNPSDLET